MALQTSGAISLNDIQTEFGGSNPISISEYYGAAAGIPSSGTISLDDFYGASASTTITEGSGTWNSSGGKIILSYPHYGYAQQRSEVDTQAPSGTYGSIANGTYNGVTIEAASYWTSTSFYKNFTIIMQGNRARSFFTSVTPQGGNTLRTSNATYSYVSSGFYTRWTWTDTSSEPIVLGAGMDAQWNGSGTSTITFV